MKKNIFDIITEYAINEGLDNVLLQNAEYIKNQNKIEEQREQFDKLNLSKEEYLIVDRLLSAYTESGAIYGKMAYRQGIQDCVELMTEMRLLKVS